MSQRFRGSRRRRGRGRLRRARWPSRAAASSVVVLEGEARAGPCRQRHELRDPAHRFRLGARRSRDRADPARGRAARRRDRRAARAGPALRGADARRRAAARRQRPAQRRRGRSMQYDDALEIPGEAVTDPVAYTIALAVAAMRHGAVVHTSCRVAGVDPGPVVATDDGERFRCRVLVNCAGLYADERRAPVRRRLVRDLSAQGRVPRVRRHRVARRSTGSCCRYRPSETKGRARVPDDRRPRHRRPDGRRRRGQGGLVGAR